MIFNPARLHNDKFEDIRYGQKLIREDLLIGFVVHKPKQTSFRKFSS